MTELVTVTLRPRVKAHCSAVTDWLWFNDELECLHDGNDDEERAEEHESSSNRESRRDERAEEDQEEEEPVSNARSVFRSLSARGSSTRRLSRALLTASRDGTVRLWDASSSSARAESSAASSSLSSLRQSGVLQGHGDWISSLVMLKDSRTLVTAGADSLIKLWDIQTGFCSTTLSKHSDYIEALAYAPSLNLLASAGLDNQLYLWRLDAHDGTPTECLQLTEHANEASASIYALGMSSHGQTLVTGGTDKLVRIWDTRTCRAAVRFSGHSDTVRALHVDIDDESRSSSSGSAHPPSAGASPHRACVSLSADGVVRVWDIRKQRSLASFEVKQSLMHNPHRSSLMRSYAAASHKSSTWTLAVNEQNTKAYIGGSSGTVIELDLLTGRQHPILHRSTPIVKLKLDHLQQQLWCSTLNSALSAWDVRPLLVRSQSFQSLGADDEDADDDEESDARPLVADTARLIEHPALELPGVLPVKRARASADSWHVYTENLLGEIHMYDVINQRLIAEHEQTDLDALIEKKAPGAPSSSSWFSIDIRLGCLSLTLEKRQALSVERSIGAPPSLVHETSDNKSVPGSQKINLGLLALSTVLDEWLILESIASSAANGFLHEDNLSEDLEHEQLSLSRASSPLRQQHFSITNSSTPRNGIVDPASSLQRQRSLPMSQSSNTHQTPPVAFDELSVSVLVTFPRQPNRVPIHICVPFSSLPSALAPRAPISHDPQEVLEAQNEQALIELHRRRSLYWHAIPSWVESALLRVASSRAPRPASDETTHDPLDSLGAWNSLHHEIEEQEEEVASDHEHHEDDHSHRENSISVSFSTYSHDVKHSPMPSSSKQHRHHLSARFRNSLSIQHSPSQSPHSYNEPPANHTLQRIPMFDLSDPTPE